MASILSRSTVFALLALAAASASAAKPVSVPDWVHTAAQQKLPAYPPETNAVVLLDETTYTVAPDGQATEHNRHVVKILRPQGRRDARVLVFYDRDTPVRSLHVWSIGPDGHEYALKDNEIADRGSYGQGNLYEDDRAKVAEAPGADPGGIVAYEVEQRTRPYLTEKTWFFEDDIPHLNQSFTLELPPGFTYGTVWAHHPKAAAIDLEHGRSRWQMDNTPGIDLDHVPMHPSIQALEGRMTVHYAGPGIPNPTEGTWKSIGEWYDRLAHDRLNPSPEIAAKAQALTAGKKDFYDRAEAVGEFVQRDIRYFGVELGIGGYQPHPAADIFRNRYGDCKDKATLLSAMLSTVGIHSALMMVDHRRNVVDPDAPSIVGDHMIAAIEVPSGYTSPKLRSVITAANGRKYLIFDPTWDQTAFGQLENNLQGGFGILMEGPASQVVALPVLAPELNTVRRHATFQLQADGDLKGSVTEKRFGDVSEDHRVIFGSLDAKEQREFLDHSLEHDLPSLSLTDVKLDNIHKLNSDFTLSYSLAAERFARPAGPLLMVRPRVLGTDSLHLEHKARSVPIDLQQTMQNSDEFEIELPPGYTVDEMPEPVHLDLGFASYVSSSRLEGRTLHYTRTYTVREVSLPASKYGELEKLANTIDRDEQSRAVLKKQ